MQCCIKLISRPIAGEHSSGPVGPVRGGRQPEDQQPRPLRPPPRHRAPPVGLVGEGTALDDGDLVIAHAGDGNTHPLLVYDPADAAMLERAHLAYGEIMDLAVGLGGTITGEHGVGRLKRPWLAGYLGPDVLALNQRIKQALDPQGILNPGSAI